MTFFRKMNETTLAWTGFAAVAAVASFINFWKSPTSEALSIETEARLLEIVKCPKVVKQVTVDDETYINTLIAGSSDKPKLVLLHGWGGGLGMFSVNIDALATKYEVFALDMPGWGRSSRHAPFSGSSCEEAQEFFVSGLEKWRESMGISEFTLVGYSLGGFVSTSYALKHPERVSRLVLSAPAGLMWDVRGTETDAPYVAPIAQQLFNTFFWKGAFSFIRSFGPFGPKLVQMSQGKYKEIYPYDDDRVAEYIFHSNAAPPSGEAAFSALMTRHGWGLALRERLHELRMGVTLVLGENDTTISPKWAEPVAKRLINASSVSVHIMRDATHALYAEKPTHWSELVTGVAETDRCLQHCVGKCKVFAGGVEQGGGGDALLSSPLHQDASRL